MGKGCRVYNPNKYDKKHCGLECSVDGYHCRKHPFHPIRRPTNGDCWRSSYRWHMGFPFLWGTPAVPTAMPRIVEDGELGDGQKTEKRMAESIGIARYEVHVERLERGSRGGAKLDAPLDQIDALMA